MSEEETIRLNYNEEVEEARIEAEKAEQKHWEEENTDIERERWLEEFDQRKWKWRKIANKFNAPVKVQFT